MQYFVTKIRLSASGEIAATVPQIEEQTRPADIRETLTEEQMAHRSRMFEEAKRRLLGGKAE